MIVYIIKMFKYIKKTNYFLFIFFILLFHSCVMSDCWYDYECIIDNKTSSDIKIYFMSSGLHPSIDTTIILPYDSSKVIITGGELDGCSGLFKPNKHGPYDDYVQYLIDSIYITMNDSMQTVLNYKNKQNWDFYVHGDSGIFKISLRKSDFVKR
jgi:hypothetical protein